MFKMIAISRNKITTPKSGSANSHTVVSVFWNILYKCVYVVADNLSVGFEVFTAVVLKSIIFWDMTLKLNGLYGVISQKMILFNNFSVF
jgi:hypothetical protein